MEKGEKHPVKQPGRRCIDLYSVNKKRAMPKCYYTLKTTKEHKTLR